MYQGNVYLHSEYPANDASDKTSLINRAKLECAMQQFSKATGQVATLALLGGFVWLLLQGFPPDDEVVRFCTVILGVSAAAAIIINWVPNSNVKIAPSYIIRYAEWVVTAPLMLLTLWAIARRFGYRVSIKPAMAFTIGMMVLTITADILYRCGSINFAIKAVMIGAAMVMLGFVIYHVKQLEIWMTDMGLPNPWKLTGFFIYGWPVYELIFLLNDGALKNILFDVATIAIRIGFVSSVFIWVQKFPDKFKVDATAWENTVPMDT